MTEKDTRDDEDRKMINFVARMARLNGRLGKLILVFMALGAVLIVVTDPEILNVKLRILDVVTTMIGWLIFLAIISYTAIAYYIGKKIEDPDFTKLRIRNMVKFYLDDMDGREEYEKMEKVMKKKK